LDACQVVALAEPRPQLAQAVAQRYNVPHVYSSAEEMLARHELDALVAPQQFTHHGSIITPLYQANLPVLTEKPLASSPEIGEKMLSALQGSTARHFVGYHKRSDPAVMWAKAQIEKLKENGELGALRYVRLTMPPGDWISGGFNALIRSDEPVPPLEADAQPSGMSDKEFKEYKSFVNYYIHQVNLLRHLLGEEYAVRYAEPTQVLLVAQSASGVAGVIEMSPYETAHGWQETALIGFERGFLKIELPAPLTEGRPGRVEFCRGAQEISQTVVPQLPAIGAMRQQAMNFVNAVRGEATPLCEAAEALQDLRVARDYFAVQNSSTE
jgi:predicted dehydrogenase